MGQGFPAASQVLVRQVVASFQALADQAGLVVQVAVGDPEAQEEGPFSPAAEAHPYLADQVAYPALAVLLAVHQAQEGVLHLHTPHPGLASWGRAREASSSLRGMAHRPGELHLAEVRRQEEHLWEAPRVEPRPQGAAAAADRASQASLAASSPEALHLEEALPSPRAGAHLRREKRGGKRRSH